MFREINQPDGAVGSEKWLTCKEVAEHWRLSQNTVNRMIRRGDLEAVRFGATWRIPAEAVLSYERRGKQERR